MNRLTLLIGALSALLSPLLAAGTSTPQTVYFQSRDRKTELVGYVFLPSNGGQHPAIVMLHGRTGPYSSRVSKDCTFVKRGTRSPCNASTLSKRHVEWGEFWAERGYVAVHVDSFGPRGLAHGFDRGTHDAPDRESVNERTVRPFDAYGALDYLRSRPDVMGDHVGVQGWSNGGSTVLNTIAVHNPVLEQPSTSSGFGAALALYPGCGRGSLFDTKFRAYGPLTVLLAGATHGFDDPGRQDLPANHDATIAARARAEAFFAEQLRASTERAGRHP